MWLCWRFCSSQKMFSENVLDITRNKWHVIYILNGKKLDKEGSNPVYCTRVEYLIVGQLSQASNLMSAVWIRKLAVITSVTLISSELWTDLEILDHPWWWTGKLGVLESMGLQRVGHDWATELNWTKHP